MVACSAEMGIPRCLRGETWLVVSKWPPQQAFARCLWRTVLAAIEVMCLVVKSREKPRIVQLLVCWTHWRRGGNNPRGAQPPSTGNDITRDCRELGVHTSGHTPPSICHNASHLKPEPCASRTPPPACRASIWGGTTRLTPLTRPPSTNRTRSAPAPTRSARAS